MLPEAHPPSPSGSRQTLTAQPSLTRFGAGPALIAAAVLAFIGLVWVVLAAGDAWSWLFGGLGTLMVVAAVALVGWAVLVRQRGLVERIVGWSHPTLEISPWPLDLGTEATVVYRRRPRRSSVLSGAARPPKVTGALVCTEWVRYTVGTDTRTATDVVVRSESVEPGQVAGPELMAVFRVTVPVDAGGPTLRLGNNRVTWTLEHELGEPAGGRTRTNRTRTRAEVVVRPVLARDIVTGERRVGPTR